MIPAPLALRPSTSLYVAARKAGLAPAAIAIMTDDIFKYDVDFNREVIGGDGGYFGSPEALRLLLDPVPLGVGRPADVDVELAQRLPDDVEGTAYFFCTLDCAGQFARRPEAFTGP